MYSSERVDADHVGRETIVLHVSAVEAAIFCTRFKLVWPIELAQFLSFQHAWQPVYLLLRNMSFEVAKHILLVCMHGVELPTMMQLPVELIVVIIWAMSAMQV